MLALFVSIEERFGGRLFVFSFRRLGVLPCYCIRDVRSCCVCKPHRFQRFTQLANTEMPRGTRMAEPLASLKSFPLDTFPVVDHVPMAVHGHGNYWELVVVTGGSGKHLLEHDSFEISLGDVFVIPAGTLHGYAECKQLGLINVLFDPRRLWLPEQHLRQIPGYSAFFMFEPELRVRHGFESRLHLEGGKLARLCEALERLRVEIGSKSPGFEVASTAIFCEMLVDLARLYTGMPAVTSQALVRLAGVLEWLEAHFAGVINVEQLAEEAHMSRKTLERCFRECFDMAPMQYVNTLRIRKAEQFLRDTDLKISEIAPRVGVEGANYFARLFRKHTGVEPRTYRAQYQAFTAA